MFKIFNFKNSQWELIQLHLLMKYHMKNHKIYWMIQFIQYNKLNY